MLTFHATGDWEKTQVHVHHVPSTRRIVPQVEQMIEQAWTRAVARPGIHLFDGPMRRMESWEASAGRLRLMLSETSYKPFWGTNLSHPELAEQFGHDVLANPVGVSPALHTMDGFLMLGRRNVSLAYYPGRIHPFAGALEPQDGGDLFAAVRRELAEELSIGDADVADIRCTGVVEDHALRQPELIFRVECRLTRRQVETQVHQEEHGASVAITATPAAIIEAVSNPALTPVAVAALILWGRATFGESWFTKATMPAILR